MCRITRSYNYTPDFHSNFQAHTISSFAANTSDTEKWRSTAQQTGYSRHPSLADIAKSTAHASDDCFVSKMTIASSLLDDASRSLRLNYIIPYQTWIRATTHKWNYLLRNVQIIRRNNGNIYAQELCFGFGGYSRYINTPDSKANRRSSLVTPIPSSWHASSELPMEATRKQGASAGTARRRLNFVGGSCPILRPCRSMENISLINLDILTDITRERVRIPFLLWHGREHEFVLDHLRHLYSPLGHS